MSRIARSALLIFGLCLVAPFALVAGLARTRRSKLRSLWVTHPIPSVPAQAVAERSLGYDVTTWAFDTGRLEHRFDRILSHQRRRPVLGPFAPFFAFIGACARYDRLHFFCDRGLLPLFADRHFNPFELRAYRLLKKQVFFWAYGADVRTQAVTRALGSPNACSKCPHPGRYCICNDDDGSKNQQRIARAATAVFSMGDMKQYTPGSINDLFYWPINLDDPRYEPAFPPSDSSGPLRVAHAPNHRFFKGTDYLLEAIDRLRSDDISIELDLIENLTNDQALQRYRQADVIFDQCLIGFHGYFSLEAMALGKPVLCFLRNPAEDVLAPAECPIVNIRPETIATVLGELAADRRRVHELGRAGRAYIERYYSVSAFAQRFDAALERLGARTT